MLEDNILLSGLVPEHKPRLLLVDDQMIHIQVMHQVFAKDCQVFMAKSGAQALAICEKQSLDLILLDVEMPDMDGFEVCRQLKSKEQTASIPIIFVTAHNDPVQEAKGLELGAVDFISKPINPPVLKARVRTHVLLKIQTDLLRGQAFRDGLTGLYNRRYFDQQFELECTRSNRNDTELSLILLDVDYFKLYNDHYGHQAGDDCLKQVAQLLQDSCKRNTDIVARYGGEEFICLLPDTSHEQACLLAQNIGQRLHQLAISHAASPASHLVTLSQGVVSSRGGQCTPHQLFALADQQLYRAKSEGRNRVCAAVAPA